MDERTVLRPGDYLTDDDRRILLFLVGPIFGAPAWQDMARTAIHDLRSDIVVVNPCLAEPNGNLGFEDQLAWERHYRRPPLWGNACVAAQTGDRVPRARLRTNQPL